MTTRVLSFMVAFEFFRVLDTNGAAAATLFALCALVACLACDGAAAVTRKLRGAAPQKGPRS